MLGECYYQFGRDAIFVTRDVQPRACVSQSRGERANGRVSRLGKPHTARYLDLQYSMLAVMVSYTMLSLWIIAQPIVTSRTA